MFALKPAGYARAESEVVDKFCLKASAENFKIPTLCCNDSTSATIRRSLYFARERNCRKPVASSEPSNRMLKQPRGRQRRGQDGATVVF
jgi:hypothetical protein